jgi:two-component system, chemotaxis family, protein-glutamate methylesterase/glutaminase
MTQNTRAVAEFRLVAMAASAGGLAALVRVLGALPQDFPLPIAVVQHVYPHHHSLMPQILGRSIALPVREAKAADVMRCGTVYVAPANYHFEIAPGDVVCLTQSEPVRHARPSADRLFQSAAEAVGRVIAVILTGAGHDGTDGAEAVRLAGGVVIAQDEATSAFFGMPGAAIDAGAVDYVLPVDTIAPMLTELAWAHRA